MDRTKSNLIQTRSLLSPYQQYTLKKLFTGTGKRSQLRKDIDTYLKGKLPPQSQ